MYVDRPCSTREKEEVQGSGGSIVSKTINVRNWKSQAKNRTPWNRILKKTKALEWRKGNMVFTVQKNDNTGHSTPAVLLNGMVRHYFQGLAIIHCDIPSHFPLENGYFDSTIVHRSNELWAMDLVHLNPIQVTSELASPLLTSIPRQRQDV
ncbi:hypothetical protein TNCV_227471 [Trichonephila clavipes]|nr:hypothetical protein TNCV_227471 [Trichonephila clavipes]